MLQFDTLELSSDRKSLIVKASVKNLEYYENILINSIVIDNQDTYSSSGPSDHPIYRMSFSVTNPLSGETLSGLKTIDITISAQELQINNGNLDSDILYVYLIADGTPSSDTPCGMDNINTLGVVINLNLIYNSSMEYIKQIESSCEIPKGFINFILEYKALELALKTKNYIQVNKYWSKFFKNKEVIPLKTNSCGCT